MAGASPVNLLDGSSTMRVWTDGVDRSRASLLGVTSEYSVVRDGSEAWTYSSTDDAVVHYAVDAKDQARYDALAKDPTVAGDLPTPAAAAPSVLGLVEQFSSVSLDAQSTVAGRDAYNLVVTPKSTTTLVGHVVISVDARRAHRCACRSGTAARRLPRSRSASRTSPSRRRRTRSCRSAPPPAPAPRT